MRFFRWMEDEIKVLSKQLTVANAEDRVVISKVIRTKSNSLRFMQDCHNVKSIRGFGDNRPKDFISKTRASYRLIALLKKRSVPISIVISYLGSLWLPRRWVTLLHPRITKLLQTLTSNWTKLSQGHLGRNHGSKRSAE